VTRAAWSAKAPEGLPPRPSPVPRPRRDGGPPDAGHLRAAGMLSTEPSGDGASQESGDRLPGGPRPGMGSAGTAVSWAVSRLLD
jgi:hypothetical protein